MATESPRPSFVIRLLRHAFSWLVVRPTILVGLGLNVRHRHRLPSDGPAIIASNHNSHLDTLVLMTLLPYRLLARVRPVAAADYFLRNAAMAWFSQRIIGVIPIHRGGGAPKRDPLAEVAAALAAREVVILFPEGTRGEPERMAELKSGVAHLACGRPEVPVIPVFLHGLGKTLPKGAWLPVPFFVDVVVGEALYGCYDRRDFMAGLEGRIRALGDEIHTPAWQ
jgi:1-acyl-sn-glycerol-3-phosphate acyltransferase